MKDQHRHSHILHHNWLLLIVSEAGIPLCVMYGCLPSMGTDVPVQPQSSLLLDRVTARQCHMKMVVWQTPNVRLGRLPWDGSMGSYGFSHGYQLKCPLKMGEDSRYCVVGVEVFIDKMAIRITCIWWRERCHPTDAIG